MNDKNHKNCEVTKKFVFKPAFSLFLYIDRDIYVLC